MKGYRYNSDYLAILNWGIKSYEESQAPKNYKIEKKEQYTDEEYLQGSDNPDTTEF